MEEEAYRDKAGARVVLNYFEEIGAWSVNNECGDGGVICDEFDRYGGSNSCSVRNDLLNGNGARYGEVSPR